MTGWQRIAGWILGAIVVVFFLADALVALLSPASLAPQMAETGFPAAMIRPVGAAALLAGLLYAWPRTAVLGAALATAFLGGAIAIHLRLGETGSPPQILCVVVGVLAWAALWLREPAARALLPLARARRAG